MDAILGGEGRLFEVIRYIYILVLLEVDMFLVCKRADKTTTTNTLYQSRFTKG